MLSADEKESPGFSRGESVNVRDVDRVLSVTAGAQALVARRPRALNVAVLTIATGKYDEFLRTLITDINKNFFAGHKVTLFAHTDKPIQGGENRTRVVVNRIRQDHLGWPFATLFRYRVFLRNETLFEPFDFLLYLDADMRIVSPVGDEMCSDLTAVRHPGFVDKPPDALAHENRKECRAYVPMSLRASYYCGGVQGGTGRRYMAACRAINAAIEADLDCGIMAEWHDESHWNRYLSDHPPAKVLGAEYCYAEKAIGAGWPKTARIVATYKDHKAVRT